MYKVRNRKKWISLFSVFITLFFSVSEISFSQSLNLTKSHSMQASSCQMMLEMDHGSHSAGSIEPHLVQLNSIDHGAHLTTASDVAQDCSSMFQDHSCCPSISLSVITFDFDHSIAPQNRIQLAAFSADDQRLQQNLSSSLYRPPIT